MNRKLIYWIPAILWMGFIFWMSTDSFSAENTGSIIKPLLHFIMPGISSENISAVHGLIRKCAHLTEYFILGLLVFRAVRAGCEEQKIWKWAFCAAIIVVLYAAGDEFHQTFVASRTASPVDIGIDSTGGIIAQIVNVIWYRNKRTRLFSFSRSGK